MRSLLAAVLLLAPLAAAEDAPAAGAPAPVPAAAAGVEAPPSGACSRWPAKGLMEGPVSLGYAEADLAVGRRACPRTEAGLGVRLGAIIDTPDFYGSIRADATLAGSWALSRRWELFATLEAFTFSFAQNAVLTSTRMTLGHLTAGSTYVIYEGSELVISGSARLLLPTSFELPGARLLGGELGTSASWRATRWLEVHGYIGGDLTGAVGRAAGSVRGGGVLLAGAQLSPFDWGALVIDLTGRLGTLSYLAPAVALRFRLGPVGLELGATLPLVGTDRHDVIAGLRANWRLD